MVDGEGAIISGIGIAHPPSVSQDSLWDGFFAQHFDHRRSARLAFTSAGVTTRHAAINPLAEDISGWSTGARMERFVAEAMPLGKEAIAGALGDAGIDAGELGLFVVVSCTGYANPGLDVRLALDLGMSPAVERVNVGHVGCHAALPALAIASDFVIANERPALMLSLELSSLHVQPSTDDIEQAIVHSLFGDGAGALVVEPSRGHARPGMQVVDRIVRSDPASIDAMAWSVTDFGFRMSLSRHVSELVGEGIVEVVEELLARNSITRNAIDAWAVHPGGPRILDEVASRLGLEDSDLDSSRKVLAEHGNCSSATIVLVLESMSRASRPPGEHIVALAFGPGLTLCAMLLRTI